MANKQRDWIIVNIDNPGFTPTDFKIVGLTAADTQLRPFDDYLSNPIITEDSRFKDNNGNFSKDKFKEFYDNATLGYQKFSQDYDTFQYDLFDPKRKIDSEIINPNFVLTQNSNPSHQTTGIVGRNLTGESNWSQKELAQKSKIFDSETGTYSESSLDDYSLFKNPVKWVENLFSNPIVYATYDSDGTHIDPISKREVAHKKGDFRVNDEGEYFTEKISGNIRGKEVVSALDLITSDTSGINKYDFFDSDGLDKSITGSLFSTVASVAPLFTPFGEIYSGALIARELFKAVPMLSGMIDSLFGTNLENNSTLNGLSALGYKFTQGTSQYSQEKSFTFENMSKLISDVAVQWGQQKLIAKGINKLTGAEDLMVQANQNAGKLYMQNAIGTSFSIQEAVKAGTITAEEGEKKLLQLIGIKNLDGLQGMLKSGKWTETSVGKAAISRFTEPIKKTVEELNRIAADTSLAYMAIISNTDVYESLLEHGTTKGEAALFTLGSMLGMFSVDRFAHLGEVFFNELKTSEKYMNNNLEEILGHWKNKLFKTPEEVTTKNAAQKLISEGKEFGKKYVGKYLSQFGSDLKYHTTGFLGKALGEGLEESAEELVTDITKIIYQQFGQLGLVSQEDVGAFENWEARYGMSALGGALGGGLFYGVGLVRGDYPIKATNEDVAFHIRNGKTKEYLKKIDEWEKKGKFGRTDLSATKYNEVTDENGNVQRVYLTASDEKDSQNHFTAERARQAIIQLDAIINGNQLGLTDEQLFQNMIMSEQRYVDFKNQLQKQTYGLNYYETYQNLVNDIVDVEQQILQAENTDTGTPEGSELTDKDLRDERDSEKESLREENLKKLQERKKSLIKQKEQFLSADTSFYYTRKMLFALDPVLSDIFFPTDYESWLEKNKNIVSEDTLSESDKQKYRKEYDEWKKTQYKSELSQMFDKFLEVEEKLAPAIGELSGSDTEYLQNYEKINELLSSDILRFYSTYWIPQKKGAEESEEDYNKYLELNKKESLTDEEQKFLEQRTKNIDDYNSKVRDENQTKINQILETLSKKLDPLSYRLIKRQIGRLRKDLFTQITLKSLEPYFSSKWTPEKLGPNETKQDYQKYLKILTTPEAERTPEDIQFLIDRDKLIQAHNSQISPLTFIKDKDLLKEIQDILINRDELSTEQMYSKIEEIFKESQKKLRSTLISNAYTYGSFISTLFSNLSDRVDEIRRKSDISEEEQKIIDLYNNIINAETSDGTRLESIIIEPPSPMDPGGPAEFGSYTREVISILYDALINSDVFISEEQKEELKDGINNIPNFEGTVYSEEDNKGLNNALEEIVQKSDYGDEKIGNYLDSVTEMLDKVERTLNTDKDYQFLIGVDEKASESNPLFKFINQVVESLGLESIEEELQLIDKRLATDKDYRELTLTDQQLTRFRKVFELLNIAEGYLYAASASPSLVSPYGHNVTVNQIIKNNPDITKKVELPEITTQTFLTFGQEIQKYKDEIDTLFAIHNKNAINKAQKFVTAKENFIEIQKQLLELLQSGFRKIILSDGTELDLFKGVESIDVEDESVKNKLIAELFHKNFTEAVEKYGIGEILEKSQLIEKLLPKDFIRQQTSKLDENSNYENFSGYSKFNTVLMWLSLDHREWDTYLKKEIEESDKIPLTIQQNGAQLAASVLNSNIYRESINYIDKHKLVDLSKVPILDKTVFVSGVGGSGKSQVVARQAISFIADKYSISSDKIIITGSTDQIRQNLLKAIGKGTILETKDSKPQNSEILKKYLTPEIYQELMSDLQKINSDNKYKSKYFTIHELTGNTSIKINWEEINKVINDDELPEIIVIDEATHFSSIELQLFNRIAKRGVVLLGDSIQDGYVGIGNNLDYETSLMAARTNKLGISLRDNNLQNQENQVLLSALLEEIKALDSDDPNYEVKARKFLNILNGINIRGFVKSDINGTLYANSLNQELIDKIQNSDAEIAFVGDESSPEFTLLNKSKDKFKSISVFKDIQDIQGQEFHYIIVGKDLVGELLNKAASSDNVREKLIFTYIAAKKLYTLISRAKVGSIIIGSNKRIGRNVIDNFSANADQLLGESFKNFKPEELKSIEDYLNTTLNITTTEGEKKKKDDDRKKEEDGPVRTYPPEAPPVTPEEDPIIPPITPRDSDIPGGIPTYSNMVVVGAESNPIEIDGKYYPSWRANVTTTGPIPEGTPVRDMEIFLRSNVTPSKGNLNKYFQVKTNYEILLRRLISSILYKKEWGEVERHFNQFLTREQYEGLRDNIFIVRQSIDKNRDVRINYLPGQNTKKEYDDGEVKYEKESPIIKSEVRIVAKYKDITLTLGLPLSQETAESNKEKFRNILDQQIDRLEKVIIPNPDLTKEDREEYQKLLVQYKYRRDNLDSDTDKYIKYINDLKEGEPIPLELDLESVAPHFYKLSTGMSLSDLRKNTGLVVSKPLIYRGKLPWINNEKMRGQPVILVSTDLTKSPDDLIKAYENGDKSVRMVVLSTKGVHLFNVMNRKSSMIFGKTISTTNSIPIAWGELGMSLFGGFWNFRANLIQFNEAYKKYFTDEELGKIDSVLNALEIEYRNNKKTEEAKSSGKTPVLETVPDYDKALAKKIEDFNKSLSNKVRQFRLGHRIDDRGNPSQVIGQLMEDKFYGKDSFGIYIHPKQAENFITLLDEFFNIFKDIIALPEEINKSQLLAEGNSNIRSKIVRNKETKKYEIDGIEVKGEYGAFGAFAIGAIRTFANAYFETLETMPSEAKTYAMKGEIKLFKEDDSPEINITGLLNSLIKMNPLNNSIFRSMMLLIVHGTTELEESKFNKTPKATDARYKQGIFIHPEKAGSAGDNFFKCDIDEDFYYLDVYPDSPTVYFSQKSEKKKTSDSGEDGKLTQDQKIDEILDLFEDLTKQSILDNFQSIIDENDDIDVIKKKIIEQISHPKLLSNTTLYYNGSKIVNLVKYLKEQLSTETIEQVIINNKRITIHGNRNSITAKIEDTMDGTKINIETFPRTIEIAKQTISEIFISIFKNYYEIEDDIVSIENIPGSENFSDDFLEGLEDFFRGINNLSILLQNREANLQKIKDQVDSLIKYFRKEIINISPFDEDEVKDFKKHIIVEFGKLLGVSDPSKIKDVNDKLDDIIKKQCY